MTSTARVSPASPHANPELEKQMTTDVASTLKTHIQIRGVRKTFGDKVLFDGLDLDLPREAITCIFGPNGCGKSTLLNIIAGLAPIDSGSILFGGKSLADTPIGYVFQNYRDALFPWLSAGANIGYPLKIAGRRKAEQRARVRELAELFDINFDLRTYPYQLSGGQQQLVSVMRALAMHPEVLFLDEPFSALDYEMTLVLRDKIQTVFEATGTTIVVVSHDLEEAVYLADQVLLLSQPPTGIAETVRVTDRRPRNPATLASDSFVGTKARCLEIFQREVYR